MPQFYKTKKCPWFAVGRCRMDKDCNWAHSPDELRPSVDLTRTKLCDRQLKEGECKDPQCRYAHSRKELRATSDLFKTSLCIYWLKGSCAVGESCRYAHGVHELRSKPQKGEFIPLEVETLPVPLEKLRIQQRKLLTDDHMINLNHLSTSTTLASTNTPTNLNSSSLDESIDKSIGSLPPFVANLFDVEDCEVSHPSEEVTWSIDNFNIPTSFTPLSLLDIPLVWVDNLNKDDNIHSEDIRPQDIKSTVNFYSDSLEDLYSHTPSTAASIRDKTGI
ncbi:zinc finger, CCCH type domain-containing protein [Cryptosporidium muris RN66]|uniref:Zinc finger, CCCH type domain-containing protein n=1 Tax=Cryptosporidium muris (strain RN66) TaxID=441375 RepID=B6ADT3_CRYMR|nr:zinc finger, CCCH type domain-containing protein [Cryptosporidium muris RN66]EEA06374.1 zinc finger, CCCH type domain-containing protein [Cryptosporidium muris RN66]|eukprot:XP_002140723.1 zinc finger, CCCH type domain-containing protein [Cryptosporidium muris RN66]